MIGTLLLNRYEILEKIGEGGMGTVYKGRCTMLNRFVAIKVLKGDFNNSDDFINRFKREANSIASLSHTNIVNIHDIGYTDNINFLVMEYVNGQSLNNLIKKNGKLSIEMFLDISLQLAKALEVAHKNNIIHRDIKPDNILITEDNIVKLMDFGIAKVVGTETLTSPNQIIGSVHYMSPEQAKGIDIDCRTDIYSLGIVMYKMLTGKVPFNGKTSVSIVLMHINNSVNPPKEVIKDLPEAINKVILKTLEKESINRFQTATELYEELVTIKESLKQTNNSTDDSLSFESENISESESNFEELSIIIDEEKIFENVYEENLQKPNLIMKKKKIFLIASLVILPILAFGIFHSIIVTNNIPTAESNPSNKSTTTEEPVSKNNTEKNENSKKQVPLVIGKTQDDAEKLLSSNGFSVGNITMEYNNYLDKGTVIKQSPESNTYYDKNGKVDLVISNGSRNSNQTKPNGAVSDKVLF